MKSFKSIITSIIVILVLYISSTNKSHAQYGKWHRDTTFHGIEFKKIRFREGKESLYAQGILKQKTIIDGYPCHKKITLTKSGHAKFFILAEDFEVEGNKFLKETQVIIRDNNDYRIHCLYKPEVQGYIIKKENYKRPLFMGSTNFQLYPDGKLKYFNPAEVVMIQDVWCKPSATRGGVHLYHNGDLQECTSSRKQTIQGVEVEENFCLRFDENGKLIFAEKEKFFK